jgi:tRNA(Phe) wybutosine-synthesizing methylase Tyw3
MTPEVGKYFELEVAQEDGESDCAVCKIVSIINERVNLVYKSLNSGRIHLTYAYTDSYIWRNAVEVDSFQAQLLMS